MSGFMEGYGRAEKQENVKGETEVKNAKMEPREEEEEEEQVTQSEDGGKRRGNKRGDNESGKEDVTHGEAQLEISHP